MGAGASRSHSHKGGHTDDEDENATSHSTIPLEKLYDNRPGMNEDSADQMEYEDAVDMRLSTLESNTTALGQQYQSLFDLVVQMQLDNARLVSQVARLENSNQALRHLMEEMNKRQGASSQSLAVKPSKKSSTINTPEAPTTPDKKLAQKPDESAPTPEPKPAPDPKPAPSPAASKTKSSKPVIDEEEYVQLGIKATNGDVDGVKGYLAKGLDPSRQDRYGCTPLYSAAYNGQLEVVKLLLEKGADLKVTSYDDFRTPLQGAVAFNHIEICKLLLKKGANPNDKDGEGPLLVQAAMNNYPEVTKLLIEAGADVNVISERNSTSAMHFLAQGPAELLRLALKKGGKVGIIGPQNCQPLHYALNAEAEDSAKALIEAGADVNAKDIYGTTPLIIAADNKMTSVAKLLIKKGAVLDAVTDRGDTALTKAVRYQAADLVTVLLDAGAKFTIADKNGMQPVHVAATQDPPEVLEVLLAHGADKDALSTEGSTPLHYAAASQQLSAVKVLVAAKAKLDILNNKGKAPLHVAVECKASISLLEALIAGGADVNLPDSPGGSTVLHWAAAKGTKSLLTLLLDKGGDPSVPDASGNTPLDVGKTAGNYEAVNMLQAKRTELIAKRNADAVNADVFISFRVSEGLAEARALKQALKERKVTVFACEALATGQDWSQAISYALDRCKVFVILGTETYGAMNAGGILSTADELRFAREKRKPISLAKMCTEYKAEIAAITLPAIMHIEWQKGTPLPQALIDDIMSKVPKKK